MLLHDLLFFWLGSLFTLALLVPIGWFCGFFNAEEVYTVERIEGGDDNDK